MCSKVTKTMFSGRKSNILVIDFSKRNYILLIIANSEIP